MTASGGLFAGFYPGAVGSAIADRQRTAYGRELGHAARGRASSGMLPLPPPPPPPMQPAHGRHHHGHVEPLRRRATLPAPGHARRPARPRPAPPRRLHRDPPRTAAAPRPPAAAASGRA